MSGNSLNKAKGRDLELTLIHRIHRTSTRHMEECDMNIHSFILLFQTFYIYFQVTSSAKPSLSLHFIFILIKIIRHAHLAAACKLNTTALVQEHRRGRHSENRETDCVMIRV